MNLSDLSVVIEQANIVVALLDQAATDWDRRAREAKRAKETVLHDEAKVYAGCVRQTRMLVAMLVKQAEPEAVAQMMLPYFRAVVALQELSKPNLS